MSETPLKQLTDSSNNEFYPVTSSSGVYRPDSSTVEAALAAIPTATSDLENDNNFISEGQANSITSSMIQDNAVASDNIDFTTFGAKYETTINGYIPLGDTAVKNIGYFTASPNRLYILRFGGGPWVGKATGIWRARTGGYSGSVFSSSVMIGPDASGIYESSTSPIFFIQGNTSSNIYLTFQPFQSAEWSFKCDVYSIEAMTS